MNEWLKKVFGKIKDLWKKWKPIQKIILIAIVVAVIAAIIIAASMSSKTSAVRVFNSQSQDTAQLNRILDRISREHVEAYTDNGYIYVNDQATATRMFDILVQDGMLPSDIDPWEGFFNRSWSTTDADQNVKLKVNIQKQLKQHIESISDITSASVDIVLPDRGLFTGSQDPVTASVILRTTSQSNLLQDRKRIQGIQRLILSAVEGLKAENLIITDADGNQINDFEGMAESDRLDLVKKQQKIIQQEEVRLRAEILKTFQRTYTEDRCRDMNIRVEMDFSQRSREATEYHPIVIREDNPDTPYDDSEYRDTLPISSSTVTRSWEGTGYNPEGPAGVEGQTPAVYSDMSNVIGSSTETGVVQNNVVNSEKISEVISPKTERLSVSLNLDGRWSYATDPKTGKPVIQDDGHFQWNYTPLTQNDLAQAEELLKGAVGYLRSRGDSVVVTNIQYDRDAEHAEIEGEFFKKEQRKKTIILVLISVLAVLIGFVLFKVISRELERRRRLREEELLRKQQAAREAALWEAKDEGMEVTMSVEETRRMELQENAITMAKEHPEDVAMLIRTWLMEE